MTGSTLNWSLALEVEDLLSATLSLSDALQSQQDQIGALVQIVELILADPGLIETRRDVLQKMVLGIKATQQKEASTKRPSLCVVGAG